MRTKNKKATKKMAKNNRTIVVEETDVDKVVEYLTSLESRQPILTVYAVALDSDINVLNITAITPSDFKHVVEFYVNEGFTVFTTEGVYYGE